jgi:hypothetical protein
MKWRRRRQHKTKSAHFFRAVVVYSGAVTVYSGTVAANKGGPFFFVGFGKKMEEILYMEVMFQKIVYGGQDLRKWQLRFL